MSPLLIPHIAAGGVSLACGAVALAARKGDRLHRRAGTVFFVAMLAMSAIGAYLAVLAPSRLSVFAGVFTFYLVGTAWVTVRRREGVAGVFEVGAMAAALGVVSGFAIVGWIAAHSPHGRLDGLPWQPAVVFGGVALLAAATDLRVVLLGGLHGAQRIARHLWRMCAALFIASSSLFLGQQQVFPAALRHSPILTILAVAPLVAMIFWLIRIRLPARRAPPHALPAE